MTEEEREELMANIIEVLNQLFLANPECDWYNHGIAVVMKNIIGEANEIELEAAWNEIINNDYINSWLSRRCI
ncbi:MAG: hypothetical protein LBC82_02885 [Oscillospiraceae bacterium]|jgi:hypothetical protein|nr:hypothetical protein [Oscillospiraceae bacterium]